MTVAFTVLGDPAPKGSVKAFVSKHGRAIVTNMSGKRERPWAQAVHWSARVVAPEHPCQGPVHVEIDFILPRPGRLGKRKQAVVHDRRPDLDKLVRSVLDALTGVLWLDDAQVSSLQASKRYADHGEPSGALVEVREVYAVEVTA